MDKDKIKQIANRPGTIPLIHNYCDRWCEKCELTSRCSVFAMREDDPPRSGSPDVDNKQFSKKILDALMSAIELIREMAEKNGVDIDAPISEEEEERYLDERKRVEENPLVKAAKGYREIVRDWFDSTEGLFRAKEEDLKLHARIELPEIDPETEALDLNDSIEIIEWYHTLIPAKVHRAVFYVPFDFPDDDDDDVPNDGDGSAKVALISVDRSIAAWMRMRDHLPEKQDEILDILIHLDRLRKSLEKDFPKARSFKRPGFDE